MAEFKSKFEIGDVVAKKGHVNYWAGVGGAKQYTYGKVTSIKFDGKKVLVSFSGGTFTEDEILPLSDVKQHAIEHLANRIKEISMLEEPK